MNWNANTYPMQPATITLLNGPSSDLQKVEVITSKSARQYSSLAHSFDRHYHSRYKVCPYAQYTDLSSQRLRNRLIPGRLPPA